MLARLLAAALGGRRWTGDGLANSATCMWHQRHWQRGKKRRSDHWGRTSEEQQSRHEQYEKRLRRRAANRELRRLSDASADELPSMLQFEERVRRETGARPLTQAQCRHYRRGARQRSRGSRRQPPPADASPEQEAEEPFVWWSGFQPDHEPGEADPRRFFHFFASRPPRGGRVSWDRSRAEHEWDPFTFGWSQRRHSPRCPQEEQHCRTLGLAPGEVSEAGLRAAFLAAAKAWHPDRHCGGSEGVRAAAEERFKRARDAFDFLSQRLADGRRTAS